MVNFYNTGIDTADLTIFLVTLGLIITPILVLGVYHLQKPRPKIKIEKFHLVGFGDEHVVIAVFVKNIGYRIAEEVKYEMISMTEGVIVNQSSTKSTDLNAGGSWHPSASVFIKKGEKCKIKIKISWENHTFLLKKRNGLTQEFPCERIEHKRVSFEKC